MMKHSAAITASAALAVLCLGSPWADAGIINVSGQVELIPPPPSVDFGDLQSDTVARVFSERQGLTLPTSVSVDSTAPGAYDSVSSLTPGVLPAGTSVDSYLVHAEPASPDGLFRYIGSITFNTDVLALIVLNPNLKNSDAILGAPGTLYSSGALRDLELNPSGAFADSVVLSPDRRTVSFDFRTQPGIDEFRLVTAAVPEPSTLSLLALGGATLGVWQFWRARQRRVACHPRRFRLAVLARGRHPCLREERGNTKKRHSAAVAVSAALAVLCLASPASLAGLITNGGFESYGGVGNSNIGAGLDGWTIGGGGIDLVPPSVGPQFYWQPEEGVVSISLNWTSPGTITQAVATTPGQLYALSFFMAAEIRGGPSLRTMDVLWDGAIVGQPTFTYTGQGPDNMGWTQFTYNVVGTGSDILAFRSTTPANFGPALDAVSLTPLGAVPEPSSVILLATGLVAGMLGKIGRGYRSSSMGVSQAPCSRPTSRPMSRVRPFSESRIG